MKAIINELIFTAYYLYYAIPALWRHMNGRFFVFRDCPDWVVWETAVSSAEHTNNDLTKSFQEAAQDELRLRRKIG